MADTERALNKTEAELENLRQRNAILEAQQAKHKHLENELVALRQRNTVLEARDARYKRQEILHTCLRRLQESIWKMQQAEDIQKVLKLLQTALTDLEISYLFCSINVVDTTADNPTVSIFNIAQSGPPKFFPIQAPATKNVVRYWQANQPVYRRNLAVEDPYGELPYIKEGVVSILDVPFSHGTLALSNIEPNAFSESDIATLQELANAISSVYSRYLDFQRLETQQGLNRALRRQDAVVEFMGTSPALTELIGQIDQVAPTDLTVLIQGETGTGKGVAARTLHANSKRRAGPFVQVNCGAIAQGLVESELFGHEKGAFTGASSRQVGKVELAEGGTLFLDEIGDMPLDAQVKLLQVLQDQTFERVGSAQPIKVDARVVAATNRNLEDMVVEGTFRQDLFFRLNTFPVTMPPLRQRQVDLPLLAQHFAATFAQHLNRPTPQISPQALDQLAHLPWPGNVRELEHLIQRAVLLCDNNHIEAHNISTGPILGQKAPAEEPIVPLVEWEKRYIQRVLACTDGKVSGENGAAKLLDIHPETLRGRMRKHGLR